MSASPRNSLQKQELEAQNLLVNSLNILTSRIEKTETDFGLHMKRLEDRLDQIVDITRSVAVLQSQSTSATDNINELRKSHESVVAKYETSIARVHTRLDEMQNHSRDKQELMNKEIELKLDQVSAECKSDSKTVKSLAETTDSELKKWLNRGWGVWVIAIIIFGAAQTALYKWVDSIEKDKAVTMQAIQTLSAFKDKTETYTRTHELEATEVKSQLKKIESSQRDIEDLISRQRQASLGVNR